MTPEDLLKVELEVVAAVSQEWAAAVATAYKAILVLIAGVEGNDMSAIVPEVQKILNTLEVPVHMDDEALAGVIKAHIFGTKLADQAVKEDIPKVKLSESSRKAVASLRADAEKALKDSKDNLSRPLIGGGMQSITTAIAPVVQNPAKTAAATAWAVNAASNSAVAKVARERGETLYWVSERDSCVTCTALNGEKASGGQFPHEKTFGAKPMDVYKNHLPHPPRHPRCRCHVEINLHPEYVAALKREALRSILKGMHLPSESEKVRIEAARRLLASDPTMPESVKKYARSAVKNSKFS